MSREPGTSSLYFHQNAYTDDKLLVTIARHQQSHSTDLQPPQSAPADTGTSQPRATNASRRNSADRPVTLATIDLSTLGVSPPKIEEVAQGPDRGLVVGRKSGNVYYVRSELIDGEPVDKVYATNLNTHETREIGRLPFRMASGLAVNADETLLGGSYTVETTDTQSRPADDSLPSKGGGGSPGQKSQSRTRRRRRIATSPPASLPICR